MKNTKLFGYLFILEFIHSTLKVIHSMLKLRVLQPILKFWTLSFIMLQNGQTYFKDLAMWAPQDFWSMFDHFAILWKKGLINPFQPNIHFLHPMKTSENLKKLYKPLFKSNSERFSLELHKILHKSLISSSYTKVSSFWWFTGSNFLKNSILVYAHS